jgi:hypothetical protein
MGAEKISKAGIYTHFKYFVEVSVQEYCQGSLSKARVAAQLQKGRLIEIVGEFVPPGEASIAMVALNDKCRSVGTGILPKRSGNSEISGLTAKWKPHIRHLCHQEQHQ